jgi:hypothetical protein
MAASPSWKIYNAKEYLGCTRYPEDAAKLVAGLVEGTVRYGHSLVVWQEGKETKLAGESFDWAARKMRERLPQRI